MALLKDGPHTLAFIGERLNKDFDLLPWQRLVNVGSLHRASLTPTDILHVTGAFTVWNREAAETGARIAARRANLRLNDFLETVTAELYYKIAVLIASRLSGDGTEPECEAYNTLWKLALGAKKPGRLIDLTARLNLPLIAVGAPAGAYFPEVAKRFQAEFYLPDHAEIANAVGTVSGKTVERAVILIKPGEGGGFLVHAPWGREIFMELQKAVAYSREEGRKYIYEQAVSAGANDIEVTVERQDRYTNLSAAGDEDYSAGDGDMEHQLFIESIIELSAVGKPWK